MQGIKTDKNPSVNPASVWRGVCALSSIRDKATRADIANINIKSHSGL